MTLSHDSFTQTENNSHMIRIGKKHFRVSKGKDGEKIESEDDFRESI